MDKQVDSPCYACRTHHGKYSLQQHFVVLHCTVLHLTVTDNLLSIRLACVDTGHDVGSFLFFSRTFTKQKAHDAFWWTVKQIWKRKTNCRLPRGNKHTKYKSSRAKWPRGIIKISERPVKSNCSKWRSVNALRHITFLYSLQNNKTFSWTKIYQTYFASLLDRGKYSSQPISSQDKRRWSKLLN